MRLNRFADQKMMNFWSSELEKPVGREFKRGDSCFSLEISPSPPFFFNFLKHGSLLSFYFLFALGQVNKFLFVENILL